MVNLFTLMRRDVCLFVLCLLIGSGGSEIQAQTTRSSNQTSNPPLQGYGSSEPANPAWLSAGILFLGGETPFFSSYPFAGDVTAHYQINANLISVRALWSGELCITCDDENESWDFSILYGRTTNLEEFHASVSAGVGLTGRKISGEFVSGSETEHESKTIGAVLQGMLVLPISDFVGIGLYGFGNINSEKSFYGVTLNLQLGRLRILD